MLVDIDSHWYILGFCLYYIKKLYVYVETCIMMKKN